jgi:hypothetical protein
MTKRYQDYVAQQQQHRARADQAYLSEVQFAAEWLPGPEKAKRETASEEETRTESPCPEALRL